MEGEPAAVAAPGGEEGELRGIADWGESEDGAPEVSQRFLEGAGAAISVAVLSASFGAEAMEVSGGEGRAPKRQASPVLEPRAAEEGKKPRSQEGEVGPEPEVVELDSASGRSAASSDDLLGSVSGGSSSGGSSPCGGAPGGGEEELPSEALSLMADAVASLAKLSGGGLEEEEVAAILALPMSDGGGAAAAEVTAAPGGSAVTAEAPAARAGPVAAAASGVAAPVAAATPAAAAAVKVAAAVPAAVKVEAAAPATSGA